MIEDPGVEAGEHDDGGAAEHRDRGNARSAISQKTTRKPPEDHQKTTGNGHPSPESALLSDRILSVLRRNPSASRREIAAAPRHHPIHRPVPAGQAARGREGRADRSRQGWPLEGAGRIRHRVRPMTPETWNVEWKRSWREDCLAGICGGSPNARGGVLKIGRTTTQIRVYHDRITIRNPAKFPVDWSVSHHRRNAVGAAQLAGAPRLLSGRADRRPWGPRNPPDSRTVSRSRQPDAGLDPGNRRRASPAVPVLRALSGRRCRRPRSTGATTAGEPPEKGAIAGRSLEGEVRPC